MMIENDLLVTPSTWYKICTVWIPPTPYPQGSFQSKRLHPSFHTPGRRGKAGRKGRRAPLAAHGRSIWRSTVPRMPAVRHSAGRYRTTKGPYDRAGPALGARATSGDTHGCGSDGDGDGGPGAGARQVRSVRRNIAGDQVRRVVLREFVSGSVALQVGRAWRARAPDSGALAARISGGS